MELDVQALSMIAGIFVPILVGVVTKLTAPSWVKAVTNALLSAITGTLATLVANSGDLVWEEFVVAVAMAWVVSVATYFGVWKPTAVSINVQQATRNLGIG